MNDTILQWEINFLFQKKENKTQVISLNKAKFVIVETHDLCGSMYYHFNS